MRIKLGLFTGLRFPIVGGLLLLTGLLFVRFVGTSPEIDSAYVPEKVNLALRRTAHHLLLAAGDSKSRIPAVQQINPQTFRIQLGHTFDYDQLPDLLQKSFRLHKITAAYDVAVLDCARGKLQLGYSVNDLIGGQSVPCGGRSIGAGCYVLQVTFDTSAPPDQRLPFLPMFGIVGLILGALFVVWRRQERLANVPKQTHSPVLPTSLLHFGRSVLDVNKLTLTADTLPHNLTYREAKLLRLLVSHPNQVLERDLILKLVWEDEGITVGRSVDVFVSRLRKLLQSDPTLKIAAVHGVGYRLEIQDAVIGSASS